MTDVSLCFSAHGYRRNFEWLCHPCNSVSVLAEIKGCQVGDWIVRK